MSLQLSDFSTVYIGYDVRVSVPDWVKLLFVNTNLIIKSTDTNYQLWKRENVKNLSLPGNGGDGGFSNYILIVEK